MLGGEQSGHIIMLDYATTGDGVLTGLQLLGRMAATGRPLADLARVVRRLPQVLRNVTGVDKTRVDTDPVINKELAAARGELGDGGRVLLRASGTEPVVRVMVEAETEADAERVAERLARVVRERLG